MRIGRRRRQHSLDAMDVATRFVNAANQHDPDTLVACAHREFESIQPAHPGRNFRGVGQLRSNWEAIFRTEPGFRLTVLRAHATEDTVWMELHGAGDDAEAAGTFILGILDGRIRWIRVYSDIVEQVPAAALAAADGGGAVLTAVPATNGEASANGSGADDVARHGEADGDSTDDAPTDENSEWAPAAEEAPDAGDDGDSVVEGPIADAEAAIVGGDGSDAEGDGDGDESGGRKRRFRRRKNR